MKTSETYIRMCDCEEIQKLKRCPKSDIPYCDEDNVIPGDVFCCKGSMSGDYYVGPDFSKGDIFVSGEVSVVHMDYPDCRLRKDGSRYSYDDAPLIWLPRQDQLQEMVEKTIPDVAGLLAFALEQGQPVREAYPTWEQLWLAFVMKEKYKKVWNGTEWTD